MPKAKKLTKTVIVTRPVEMLIYVIRGQKVMLDAALAALYEVTTKRLNEAVRRNLERFPEDFMFQLTPKELASLRSQIATSNLGRGGRRYAPYAFTQEGVAMLSSVLRSPRAIQTNIAIMRAFMRLRKIIASNSKLASRIAKLERGHDRTASVIEVLVQDIDRLVGVVKQMRVLPEPKKRRIGFHVSRDAD
jgi:ORF6N domain